MIRCKKCNFENEFDRVLCISCGEKLDFNDPSLIENTIQEKKIIHLNKNRVKVTLKNDSFITNIIYVFVIFLFFMSVFFMFSASNVPSLKFSSIAANSLNEKLFNLTSTDTAKYLLFSTDEINLYIERILSLSRSDISKKLPSFISLERIIFGIKNSKANLFIIFNLLKRRIIIKLSGEILIKNNNIFMDISKSFVGELLIPKSFVNLMLKNIYDVLKSKNSFKIPDSVTDIKIDKEKLIVFTKNIVSSEAESFEIEYDYNLKVPDDVLLIQAADSFYNNENYRLALKYFTLVKIKFPNSPFKSHALKQIKLCQERL